MTGYQKLKEEKILILDQVKEARDRLMKSKLSIPVIEEVTWLLDEILMNNKR